MLLVVYAATGKVLLLKRADPPDFWQSVTGSLRWEEREPREAAVRELREETGLAIDARELRDMHRSVRYPVLPPWRDRFAAGVTANMEHAFALELPAETALTIHPAEHVDYGWFSFDEAAAKVASWSNREAIRDIARGQR